MKSVSLEGHKQTYLDRNLLPRGQAGRQVRLAEPALPQHTYPLVLRPAAAVLLVRQDP